MRYTRTIAFIHFGVCILMQSMSDWLLMRGMVPGHPQFEALNIIARATIIILNIATFLLNPLGISLSSLLTKAHGTPAGMPFGSNKAFYLLHFVFIIFNIFAFLASK